MGECARASGTSERASGKHPHSTTCRCASYVHTQPIGLVSVRGRTLTAISHPHPAAASPYAFSTRVGGGTHRSDARPPKRFSVWLTRTGSFVPLSKGGGVAQFLGSATEPQAPLLVPRGIYHIFQKKYKKRSPRLIFQKGYGYMEDMALPVESFQSHFLSTLGALLGLTPEKGKVLKAWDEPMPEPRRRVPFEPTMGPNLSGDMVRLDGTLKGPGWLGDIPGHGKLEGSHLSELSVGVPGTEEGFFPLLVPGMPQSWVESLAGGLPATPEMFKMARAHADQRMRQGLSPFRGYPEPQGKVGPEPQRLLPGELDMIRKDAQMGSDDPWNLNAALDAWAERGYGKKVKR